MGEAKRRGTYEERKAQAIKEGRIKTKRGTRSHQHKGRVSRMPSALTAYLLAAAAAAAARNRR